MRLGQPRLSPVSVNKAVECFVSTADRQARFLSGFVYVPREQGKCMMFFTEKKRNITCMRKQCVPGPLSAFWEGPGYEARPV